MPLSWPCPHCSREERSWGPLAPRKIPFQPNGVAIDLSRETGVRIEIEALARALNEKAPDEVYVVPVANAAVLDRGDRRIMLRL